MTADHAAIRARLDAATSGPWRMTSQGGVESVFYEGPGEDDHSVASVRNERDWAFIAHAPDDVRALLTDYDAVKREMESRELHHFEVETENEALLAVIEAAPHEIGCDAGDFEEEPRPYPCDCWKAKVPARKI